MNTDQKLRKRHTKIIDFGCLTNPLGFVQSQQDAETGTSVECFL